MSGRVRISLNTGYWLAIVVIVANSLVTNLNLLRLTSNNRRVVHTHKVLDELEHTFSALKDAETSVRGFFLSNQVEHLETYRSALPEISLSLDRLTELMGDDAAQAAQIATLRRAVDARLSIIKESLVAQEQGGLDLALDSIRTGRGRRAMEEVRAFISSIEAGEEQRLARRSAEADATVQRTILGFTITSALAILLLGLIYYLSQRDFAERKAAAEVLGRYAERLSNLLQIGHAILAAGSPPDIAQAALRHLRRLVPCREVRILTYDPATGESTLLASESDGNMAGGNGQRLSLKESKPDGAPLLKASGAEGTGDVVPSEIEPTGPCLPLPGSPPYCTELPLVDEGQPIGALVLGSDRPDTFTAEHLAIAGEVAAQLGLALRQARLFEQVSAGQQRLQLVSRRLMSAQETERRHLARELHDEVGQALTAVKVNLQRMSNAFRASGEAPHIEESTSLIERILGQVRNLSLDLRPSMLDDLGLVSALRWHVDRQSRRAEFSGQVIADPPDIRANPEIETTCFRVVQEALTNIIRHARARHVRVELRQVETGLRLTISDDGQGFDVSAARQRARQGASFGLLGIEERVELAGGRVEFKSVPGKSTTIRAVFPLASCTPRNPIPEGQNGHDADPSAAC